MLRSHRGHTCEIVFQLLTRIHTSETCSPALQNPTELFSKRQRRSSRVCAYERGEVSGRARAAASVVALVAVRAVPQQRRAALRVALRSSLPAILQKPSMSLTPFQERFGLFEKFQRLPPSVAFHNTLQRPKPKTRQRPVSNTNGILNRCCLP